MMDNYLNTCEAAHPTLRYRCPLSLGHEGPHECNGATWVDTPAGPVVHLATSGPALGIDIQHPSGDCVWCDAQRWRNVIATYDGQGVGFDPTFYDQVRR